MSLTQLSFAGIYLMKFVKVFSSYSGGQGTNDDFFGKVPDIKTIYYKGLMLLTSELI